MYHSISDDPESGVSPYYRVATSPARFAAQMQWLRDSGYRGVTLTEGLAWLNASRSEIENRKSKIGNHQLVVLTFDDGFRDFHTAAWPVLREHNFTATMFLPTAFIGTGHSSTAEDVCRRPSPSPLALGGGEGGLWPGEGLHTRHAPRATRHSFRGKECLTWREVRELHEAGIEFGSHTVNHPKLVDLPWPQIEFQLRTSKLEIEARLGCAVTTFAYPYAYPEADAAFIGRFESLLADVGYAAGVTTCIGRALPGDTPLCLKRLPVNSLDDLELLVAKLEGAYDWIGGFQSLSKKLRLGRLDLNRGPELNSPV